VRRRVRRHAAAGRRRPWNLKRLATLRGSPGPVVNRDPASVGNELVTLVRARYGLEVILINCSVDTGALDDLRKHAQVSIGDEWVYVKRIVCTTCNILGLKAHRWGDKTKGGYWYLSLVPVVLWVYSMDVS
jgi:hypothetical protein